MTRGGEEVRVEPKVMQVLEALAATPGDVVTREQLVAQVWPGVFVSDDVLHRAIRELRRAFGDDTANPQYVETIRKRGYRLIATIRSLDQSAAPAADTAAPTLATPPRRANRFLIAASIALAAVL